MSRFFLIDPWLADATGHNYQYALDVAEAARQQGYDPLLAIRSCLSADLRFPAEWRIEKLFDYGDCAQHWISLGERNRHPSDLDGRWLPDSRIAWWKKLLDLPSRLDRRRRITSFAGSCSKLFAQVPPRQGDLLYLPSLTEFDFLCAARFWRDHPWTRDFDWHLQFHFNFFVGRDPEFGEQPEVLSRFQRLFREAVDQIPEHRLHFYATTEAISRQYDALGVAIFHPLPYPVRALSGAERTVVPSAPDRPLRVTLPGAMRREKGKKQLGLLIDSVWDEFLKPCRVQFVFQARPNQIAQWLPGRVRRAVQIPPAGSSDLASPLLATSHPLDAKQYSELICSSDIGLFVYDARRYFPRASGVMCEMLSAGVPVIVPAGCWLADQVAEENFCYVDKLWRRYQNQSEPIELSTTADPLLSLPSKTHSLLLQFDWPTDTPPGTYGELVVQSAEQSANRAASPQREVLNWREYGPAGVLVRFSDPVTSVRISLKNAFGREDLRVPSMRILPLPSSLGPTTVPLGSVALIAADEHEVPRLLREMTANYQHYASTAHSFATRWQSWHSASHTVSRLAARTQGTGTSRGNQAA